MPEIPSQPFQPQNPVVKQSGGFNWKKVVLVSIVIAAVLALIVWLYWVFMVAQPASTSPVTTPVSSPSTKKATPSAQKDETAGWKVYKNEKLKFQLKYPDQFKLRGSLNDFGTGQYIINYQESMDSYVDITSVPGHLAIDWLIEPKAQFHQEIREKYTKPGVYNPETTSIEIKETTLSGKRATKKTVVNKPGTPGPQGGLAEFSSISYFVDPIDNEGVAFVIKESTGSNEKTAETLKLFEEIISTFKFLSSTSSE